MPAKIRLARHGRKKNPFYHIVVADSRAPRDGRYIEKLGVYNPSSNPARVEFDEAKALEWLLNGAQPTETVKAMLSYRGVLYKKHLQIGVIKGALTQEEADKKYEAWRKEKDAKISAKQEKVAKEEESAKKKAMEAERKKKEARAEALKQREAEAAAEAEAAEQPEEEAPAAAGEENATAEAAAEETPTATEEAVKEEAEAASEPKEEEELKKEGGEDQAKS